MTDRKVLVRYKTNTQEIPAGDTAEVGNGVKASAGGNLNLYGANILSDSNLLPTQDGYFDLGADSYNWNYIYSSYLTGGQVKSGIAGGSITAGYIVGITNSSGSPKVFLANGLESDDRKYVVGIALNDASPGDTVYYQYSGYITVPGTIFFVPSITTDKYGPVWLYDVGMVNFTPNLTSGFVNQKIGTIIQNTGDNFVTLILQLGYLYVQP